MPQRRAAARATLCSTLCALALGAFGFAAPPAMAQGAGAPASPAEGGPRRFEVAVESGSLALRAGPGASAEVLARLARGAVLTNLGCAQTEGRVWCDVQPMRGGPRGYAAAEFLRPARGPSGDVPVGEDDSALRAGQGAFDATGTIPCAEAAGQPMTACDFGVAPRGRSELRRRRRRALRDTRRRSLRRLSRQRPIFGSRSSAPDLQLPAFSPAGRSTAPSASAKRALAEPGRLAVGWSGPGDHPAR